MDPLHTPDRIAQLMRRGAILALRIQPDEIEELASGTFADEPLRAIAEDPVLIAGARRSLHANMRHWAESILRDPSAPVDPNVGPEPLAIARDLVRRGLDEPALHAYRTAHTLAWQRWMKIAFELTQDPDELQELLECSARSMSDFVGATMVAVSEQLQLEREHLTRGSQAEKREVVSLILDGEHITDARAATRLGYLLSGHHTAVVIWNDNSGSDIKVLDRIAKAVIGNRSRQTLTVNADAGTLWLWVGGASPLDLAPAEQLLGSATDVRVAVGPPARDSDGFRESHRNALTTQRMLTRLHSRQQLARFEDVQLVALMTENPVRAAAFTRSTLGELETAGDDLRETVRVYLREQSNAAQAAKCLFTHRNTLLRRLARADQLLPRPLAQHPVEVAAALEVLHWRGDAD